MGRWQQRMGLRRLMGGLRGATTRRQGRGR